MGVWRMKIWLRVAAIVMLLVFLAGVVQFGPQTLYGLEGEKAAGSIAARLRGAIALYVDSPVGLVDNQEIKLDAGNDFITPLLVENRVLVPVRFIAENLGGSVHWDGEGRAVSISLGERTIKLTLSKPEIIINGQAIPLEVSPQTYLNRTYVPLRAVSEAFGKKVEYNGGLVTIADNSLSIDPVREADLWEYLNNRLGKLPVLGSAENLKQLLEYAETDYSYLRLRAGNEALMKTADAVQAPSADSANSEYSRTNIQVQGVDEADLVKTDGRYIYQVSGDKVIISQAYPAETMKIAAVLHSDEAGFIPQELYVDQDNLVVIGRSQTNRARLTETETVAKMIMPPPYYMPRVKAIVYDIKDKQNVTKTRELELEGSYVSSRKIGNALYLVANQYVNYYRGQEEPIMLPAYRDSVLQSESVEIPYSDIKCFPPVVHPNYLLIAGLNLAEPQEAAQVSAYLGSGEDIYVSGKHLFVAVTRQGGYYPGMPVILREGPAVEREENTVVYKFALNQGKVSYLHKGQVPGRVLNQFSMDEYEGNFRIATTAGYSWSRGGQTSRNNLYVLDSNMGIIGRLEGLAPGEEIYSARFMGKRAYLVTFKTVDPLFVLDLQDPKEPKILGALKIPGYSDYLHPFDDSHLIGFGKDTIELPQKDYRGKTVDTAAYYLGMKIALFDVSDVANPKELFAEKIGDRGTSSELLNNHKALLFDGESGLLSFPVTVMEVPDGSLTDPRTGMPVYGRFSYQGAYVYNLNLTNGFTLRGRISHLDPQDYLKAGYSYPEPGKEVQRILYIKDTLYTLSDSLIKANDLSSLDDKASLLLP